MDSRYNVAIVGKTGVGKSALVNYLYGDLVAKSGIGKPVTTNGFHPVKTEINGLPVTIYDSWGLEVGKESEWMSALDQELAGRGVDRPAADWFHSVFYCIQAPGGRVEKCDVEIVKKFVSNSYKVSIILTKSDLINEADESALENAIMQELGDIPIISVCSERKPTRGGQVSNPFGKDDLEKQAFADFFDSLITRLPERCKAVMQEHRDAWWSRSITQIDSQIQIAGFNEDEVRKKIEVDANATLGRLAAEADKEVATVMKMYKFFSEKLGYPPVSSLNPIPKKIRLNKPNSEMPWYEWVAVSILIVPIVIAGLTAGKSLSKEELTKNIRDAESSMNQEIELITKKIREMLLHAKNDVLA